MRNEAIKIDLSQNLSKVKEEMAVKKSTPTLNVRKPRPVGKLPKIMVPFIFYWEEMKDGVIVMTAAFEWEGLKFGESWVKGSTNREAVLNKTHLLSIMRDTLMAVVHHGRRILDSQGNINPTKFNDEEAMRDAMDPLWGKKMDAFNQTCKVKEITKDQATKIGLLK